MQPDARKAKTGPSSIGDTSLGNPVLSVWLPAILCAVATFLLCLWQNPSSVPPQTTLYFDAGHYLDSVKRIHDFCHEAQTTGFTKSTAEALAYFLMLDGPVLPSFAAIVFFLTGIAPSETAWFTLVLMQCCVHAVSAGMIFLLTKRLTDNSIAGVVAALLFAAHPATLSSAGLFLTEPLACLLMLTLFLTCSQLVKSVTSFKSRLVPALATGILTALLALLKPALLPAIGCIFFALVLTWSKQSNTDQPLSTFSKWKSISIAMALVIVGAAITVAPWLAFTKFASGSYILLPSRKPVFNIATGMNLETDGWGSYPTQAFTKLFSEEDNSGAGVISALFSNNPADITNLMTRKTIRLWSTPWNDYRYKLLGMNFRTQTFVHSLLMLFGMLGGAFFLATAFKTAQPEKRFLIFGFLMAIAAHFVYLPFEGIARYGYTSVPLMIILAVGAACTLFSRRTKLFLSVTATALTVTFLVFCRQDLVPFIMQITPSFEVATWLETALRLSVLSSALLLWYRLFTFNCVIDRTPRFILASTLTSFFAFGTAVSVAFAMFDREGHEWQCVAKPGQAVRKTFDLSSSIKPKWILVAVDGDPGLDEATVSVNGVTLPQLRSIFHYHPDSWNTQVYAGTFASLLRRSPDQIRHWRAIEVPMDLIDWKGSNIVEVKAGTRPATIFGDYLRRGKEQRRYLPGWDEVSPAKLFNAPEDDAESRFQYPQMQVLAPSNSEAMTISAKKGDLSSKPGKQTGDYRIQFIAGYAPGQTEALRSDAPVLESSNSFNQQLDSKSFGLPPQSDLLIVPGAQPNRARIAIPKEVLKTTHSRISLSLSATAPSPAHIAIAAVLENGSPEVPRTILPGTPKLFAVSGNPVQVSAELPSSVLAGPSPYITVELSSVGAPVSVKYLSLQLIPVTAPVFRNHRVRFL